MISAILLAILSVAYTERPNILFIIVDDLGWADVPGAIHNNGEYSLPFIEREIYGNGVEFLNYYTAPVCTPTRASFMTGRYAWKLGLQDVQTMPPCVDERIPTDTQTVAQVLQNDGYKTYYVGKWHLGYAKWSDTPIGRGFDYAYGYLQGEGDYYNHTFHLNVTGEDHLEEGHDIVGYDMFSFDAATGKGNADWNMVGEYGTDIFLAKARDYFMWHGNGYAIDGIPFYMYLSLQTIHEPIQAPPGNAFADECNANVDEDRKIYCQKMKYLDRGLEQLFGILTDFSLYDNTLIVFTTDNGGMVLYDRDEAHPNAFYMPNSYGCNYPYRAGKATLFEGGIKAIGLLTGPLIPQGIRGTQSNYLIHAVDWFTTILNAAGVSSIPTNDGLNLLNYLTDQDSCSGETCAADTFDRQYIFPNIDITNALKLQQVEVTVSRSFRIRKTQVTLNRTISRELSDGYGDMPFDAVIYNDGTTLWKLIRGYQLYYGYYNCYPQRLNEPGSDTYVPSDTWETTEEWLFDLTNNPYEYESQNYLSPTFDQNSVNNYNEAMEVANNLRQAIENQLNSGEFVAEQPGTKFWESGLPGCSEGTFEPWLDEDGTELNTECNVGCDFTCVNEILTHTSG